MTRQETADIMMILETAYPRFYGDKTKQEKQAAIDLWATMFADDNNKIVTEAVKSMICTLKFPPTIADVKEMIALIMQPAHTTEMEAWETVRKAISYYNSQENFNNLPPVLQKLVGSSAQLREWAVMDVEVVNSVVQSNFMRSYSARAKQIKEYIKLPESAKKLINDLSQKMLMDGEQDAKA